ncbi:hypothetical protein ACFLS9_03765 [Bacteroidota bacterium]
MENKRAISKKRLFFFYTFIILIPVVLFAVVYMGYVAIQTADIYQYVKSSQRGWKGKVHVADEKLGYAPVPGSSGAHVFPVGPDIPMQYDEDGFRVPIGARDSLKQQRPLVLALGCSFTYGDATYAKDTYPYLVGQSLGGSSKNAGVCGYGLSQMFLLSKKLIPIHKPDYLLVQYSGWLVRRARNPFPTSYFGKIPSPYFYDNEKSFALYPPVFLTKKTKLPIDQYRGTKKSIIDALSFYFRVGLPLFVHDHLNMLKYGINKNIGIIPDPTNAKDRLIKYVYKEICKVADKYGASVVVVVLGKNAKPVNVKEELFPPGVILVKTYEELLRRLPIANNDSYKEEYAHWRGSPPRVVDSHPNETAHKIIASTIVSAIRRGNSN